jgi:phosphatidylglycerophosphate synthase
MATEHRRPLKSRGTAWAALAARGAIAAGLGPNQISLLSILFAAAGAYALMKPEWPWALVIAALCIQLRLLCNLLDGMVAVEGGRGTATGPLWNEVPDRIADTLFLVSAGYGIGWTDIGWACALLAALTAYVRLLGGTLGLAQDFSGPQAKPQRMALLTLACLLGALESSWLPGSLLMLKSALALIAVGTLWTLIRRTRRMAAALRAHPRP